MRGVSKIISRTLARIAFAQEPACQSVCRLALCYLFTLADVFHGHLNFVLALEASTILPHPGNWKGRGRYWSKVRIFFKLSPVT